MNDGRRAAAVAAAAAFDDPARAAAARRRHRHQRQDDDGRHAAPPARQAGARERLDRHARRLLGSEGVPLRGGASLTTPGPIELQRVLRALVDRGVRTVAMEVSSHSLDQHRVGDALVRRGGVHEPHARSSRLPRHDGGVLRGEGAAGLAARPTRAAVVNLDDATWRSSAAGAHGDHLRRSIRRRWCARSRCSTIRRGSEWLLVGRQSAARVQLPLIGDFNVINALGAAAAAWHLGVTLSSIAAASAHGAAGAGPSRGDSRAADRAARLRAHARRARARARRGATVRARRSSSSSSACGGDRDKGKRPLMGAIAEQGADYAIVTSDNPAHRGSRSDPRRHRARACAQTNHERIEDRREAIARALEMASPEDVIVLAGKGHETYQVRGTTAHPFDEKVIVAELTHVRWSARRSGRIGPHLRRRVAVASAPVPRATIARLRVSRPTRARRAGRLLRRADRRAIRRARLPARRRWRRARRRSSCRDPRRTRRTRRARVRGARHASSRSARSRAIGGARGTAGRRRRRIERQDEHEGAASAPRSSASLAVHATTGNLNNLIGVPLTLLAHSRRRGRRRRRDGNERARARSRVCARSSSRTSRSSRRSPRSISRGSGSLAGVMREESAIFDGCGDRDRAGVAAGDRGGGEGTRRAVVVTAGLDAGDLRADAVVAWAPTAWARSSRRRGRAPARARRSQSAQRDARARGRARARRVDGRRGARDGARDLSRCAWRWRRSGREGRRSSTTRTTRIRLDAGGDRLLAAQGAGASAWRCSARCSSSGARAAAARRGRARALASPVSRSSPASANWRGAARGRARGDPRVVVAATSTRCGRRSRRGSRRTPLSCSRGRAGCGSSVSFAPLTEWATSRSALPYIHASRRLAAVSASIFNVFNYISFRAVGAAVTALLLSFIVGPTF